MKNHVIAVPRVSCQALFQGAGLGGRAIVKFVVCLPVTADAFGRKLS